VPDQATLGKGVCFAECHPIWHLAKKFEIFLMKNGVAESQIVRHSAKPFPLLT